MDNITTVTVLIAVCFVIGFILTYGLAKKYKGEFPKEFDERQISARGKAHKAGFLSMVVYYAVYTFASWIARDAQVISEYSHFFVWCGVVLGLGVFIVRAIKEDAFLALKQKPAYLSVLCIIVIVLNIIPLFLRNGEPFSWSSIIKDRGINLSSAVFFILVLVANLIHQRKAGKLLEESNEES